jgi:threonine/homoserine/homoserine lactone efflux protein
MITTLSIIASITFISMMSPGPDLILIVKTCTAKEKWPVLACISGICCGLSVHVSLAILGIAAMVSASEMLFSIVKIAGAIYLIYVGVKSILSGTHLSVGRNTHYDSSLKNNPFRDGLLCNLLNPKVTLFVLAMFTQVVAASSPILNKSLIGAFMITEAFLVWCLFATLTRTSLILKFIQRFELMINRVAGALLICFGLILAFAHNN